MSDRSEQRYDTSGPFILWHFCGDDWDGYRWEPLSFDTLESAQKSIPGYYRAVVTEVKATNG